MGRVFIVKNTNGVDKREYTYALQLSFSSYPSYYLAPERGRSQIFIAGLPIFLSHPQHLRVVNIENARLIVIVCGFAVL